MLSAHEAAAGKAARKIVPEAEAQTSRQTQLPRSASAGDGAVWRQPAAQVRASSGRPKRPRVIRVSVVDARRIAAGEIADPVEATHQNDAFKVQVSDSSRRGQSAGVALDAREQEMLDNVPPHFGRL